MKLINEAEIFDTWAPIIEQKAGITDPGKQAWLSKYCHYHSLNESAGAYQSLNVVNGMGPVTPPAFPASTQALSTGGLSPNQGFYSQSWQGSGSCEDCRFRHRSSYPYVRSFRRIVIP